MQARDGLQAHGMVYILAHRKEDGARKGSVIKLFLEVVCSLLEERALLHPGMQLSASNGALMCRYMAMHCSVFRSLCS